MFGKKKVNELDEIKAMEKEIEDRKRKLYKSEEDIPVPTPVLSTLKQKTKSEHVEEKLDDALRSEIISYLKDTYGGGFHDPNSFSGNVILADYLLILIWEVKQLREQSETGKE